MAHLDASKLRRIAVSAQVDPRTVARYAQGAPLRSPEARERIARALREDTRARANEPHHTLARSYAAKTTA